MSNIRVDQGRITLCITVSWCVRYPLISLLLTQINLITWPDDNGPAYYGAP